MYQYKARMKHRSWHENITSELEHMQFEHGSKLATFSVSCKATPGAPNTMPGSVVLTHCYCMHSELSTTPAIVKSIDTTRPYPQQEYGTTSKETVVNAVNQKSITKKKDKECTQNPRSRQKKADTI